MAELNFSNDWGADEPRPVGAQLMNISGAVLSIALIVGLAIWGWQLLKRDVTGIPVVRALEGPMREAPVDPGGVEAAHQGLSVMQEVAAADGETVLPPQVILADPIAELEEEDVPAVAQVPPEVTVAPIEDSPVIVSEPAAPAPPLPTVVESTDDAVEKALAEALGTPSERISPSIPGITASLRPRARPEQLVLTSVTPTAANTAPDPMAMAATVAAGTRMVQLGAFTTSDEARTAWTVASDKFAPYMTGKTPVIQKAETGGRSFYRLRAVGFEDLADARRFCSVLVADGASCIPVIRQ